MNGASRRLEAWAAGAMAKASKLPRRAAPREVFDINKDMSILPIFVSVDRQVQETAGCLTYTHGGRKRIFCLEKDFPGLPGQHFGARAAPKTLGARQAPQIDMATAPHSQTINGMAKDGMKKDEMKKDDMKKDAMGKQGRSRSGRGDCLSPRCGIDYAYGHQCWLAK